VCLQLLDEFLALYVVRICLERFVGKLEAFLEFAKLKSQQAAVERRLEEMWAQAHGRMEMRLGLFHVALPKLQDAKIAVALRVIGINGYSDLECLVGKADVTDTDGHLANIVPDIRHVVVVR